MEETKKLAPEEKMPFQTGAIRMLVPTKVETTLTVSQLWNGLFSALFGTPADIQGATGVGMEDLYVAKFKEDNGFSYKVCYMKDGKEEVYSEMGAIWRNMLKIGNDIFPGADMPIEVKEGQECSKEEDTSSEKTQE